MDIRKTENSITVCGTKDFDPEKTLECGQVFRYFKNAENDYTVRSRDKVCSVKLVGSDTVISTSDPDYFYNYFDLNTDYDAIFTELKKFPELAPYLDASRGLRILKQDVFESCVSFIISANNNIKRIQGIIERMCARYGSNTGDGYAFVTPKQFYDITEENFKELGAGFRSNYLFSDRDKLCDESYLSGVCSLPTADALTELTKLKGIGEKVASCILLFGMGRGDSYPVDTWIFKANKTDELNTPEKVRRFYLNRYGSLAGYAQQYIFYGKRNLKK